MQTLSILKFNKSGLALMSLFLFWGCQNEDSDLQEAKYSTNPDVFIDTFSSGLEYSAFGNTVFSGFQADNKVSYNKNGASMRFDIPNVNDPAGAYVGGSFYTSVGRDLSSYDALTFWAKSTQAAKIDVIGFGNDFASNKYQASLSGLEVTTVWKKYIIPIPDPSKLKVERGMLFVAEGPENDKGYTFWLDEVKFEKLGTISSGQGGMLNGQNKIETSFIGVQTTIDGLTAAFSMPNGINQAVNLTPAYFVFTSSNPAVATVDDLGKVKVSGVGTAVVTATLGGEIVKGSLTINSPGVYTPAPIPMLDASKVISVFTEKYPNIKVDYYNGYWQPYQTTTSADFAVNGDNVLNYNNFNFVGIQFSAATIDATLLSHLHLDLYLPNPVVSGTNFKVQLVDFGADGVQGGTDDKSSTVTITNPTLVAKNWISLNIPLSSYTGLTTKTKIGQIIFEGTNINSFYADNIYFYNDGSIVPAVPAVAAPTPVVPAASVVSIFSDAYTNVPGTNFNPNWGQATAVTQTAIAGNNTLRYGNLNYQGVEFASGQNLSSKTHLHLDYYSSNSTTLKVYLISPGPVERAYTLSVPGGWKSIDIPLTNFSPVNLSNVIQMKFDGNGTIYLDNIYFKN